LIWREQFAVDKIKVTSVYDELNTGKLICPEINDKQGRPVMILRPRYVSKSQTDLLNFMKLTVYMVEKCISRMKNNVEQIALIVDFTGASLKNVDFRIPRTLITTMLNNYPRRIGSVDVIHPPWFFKYVWTVISAWMDADFRSRVRIGTAKGLLDHFTEDNILEEMGGKKPFDFREWARLQIEEEKVDVNSLIKKKGGDDQKKRKRRRS